MADSVKVSCPFCDKKVTRLPNLFKHLSGGYRYDGHELPADEANKIVESVFSGTYSGKNYLEQNALPDPDILRTYPDNPFGAFLEEYLITLVENKELPNYQFERRMDTIFYIFLPDLLSTYFGNPVETLVPEFPLKKYNNWQSTNVDSLLYMRDGESDRIKYWLFLELKTDDSSFSNAQIDIYEKTMQRNMPSLVEDVKSISKSPKASPKYPRLLKLLETISSNDQTPIRFIYLAPTIPSRLRLSKRLDEPFIYPLTFAQLENIPVKRFPEAWEMFRRIAIPALKPRYQV